ncbi:synaptonemal complex protein 1 isoform X2 [Anoplophora glabripennis]|uniref:synaptonemal complex protein 1 isoform X2 n=1 Tax=Anoplophora glabripennis TaxID=217634 RepID=UPI0008755930|nr:synaptonemal complex protein 1 isoform X2 [Anoplophora glabripennis]
MSDTDDTDDLLLIPPDFFVIDSDSGHSGVEPYYNIVDNLIQKVSNLQERIHNIETSSLNTSLDFDITQNMQKSSGFRKYNSIDDLYVSESAQSTPQKAHTKFRLNSLPASPNIEKFSSSKSIRATRDFKSSSPRSARRTSPDVTPVRDSQTSSEIDTFLSKVKTIQRINASRNLDREFGDVGIPRTDKNEDMDRFRGDFDQHYKDKQRTEPEPVITKEKTWRQGDNKESVPDYGMGMRENLYKEHSRQSKPKANFKKPPTINDSWTSMDKYPSSDSSSDSTQITAYMKERSNLFSPDLHSNALNVLNMHKQLLETESQKLKMKAKAKEPKPRSANTLSDNLGLLSLADIWSTNSHLAHSNPTQLLQKLQEEKLRRQHCEGLIQDLQNRNLELQQKLSVAVKVDESKNKTIQQFQEALQKLISRLEKVNKEKQDWEQEVATLKSSHSSEMEEYSQKVAYYEKEASKALNLAHGNQEKLSSLEKRCAELQSELQNIERKCREIEDDYGKELERNKQMSDILSQKELELSENKTILNQARMEVAESKRAVEVCQAEFTSIKTECNKLKEELKEEKEQIIKLKEEKHFLLGEVDEHKKREGELKEELNKVRKQLDNSKLEMRNFYQGQVEILVQNKLKEFQTQLDQAERTFKEEVKKREMSIAKTAATHIQQVSEKYTLEIKLLEKKHQEEIKLYEIQIMQHKQQVDGMQSKMDQLHDKRVVIAKQLQRIMESQWAEAMRIITRSPVSNEETFSTIDQLNSLKTKSYNNVEEVLAQQHEEHFNVARKAQPQFPSFQNEDALSSIGNNFEKNPREGFDGPVETPVSSRTQGSKPYNENEIQQYINLLLNRPPGNPTQESQQKEIDGTPENVTDRATWQHVRSRKHK